MLYNDNVNSPEMRDWLGKIVGKEADGLMRQEEIVFKQLPYKLKVDAS